MMKSTRPRIVMVAVVMLFTLGTVAVMPTTFAADKKAKKKDKALERTRDTVKMLDDVYKTAVVLITTHYVNKEDDLPAGTAAIALFDAISKKGSHHVRLMDASGEPLEEKNTAQDDFEKEAVKQLKAGKPWHEEVIEKEGKRYLRAVTPIPVVLEKCTMCHPNYKEVKKGEAIGAISYTIQVK